MSLIAATSVGWSLAGGYALSTDTRICVVSTGSICLGCSSSESSRVICWQVPSEKASWTVLGRHSSCRRGSDFARPGATEISRTVAGSLRTIRIDPGALAADGVDGGTHAAAVGSVWSAADHAVAQAVS